VLDFVRRWLLRTGAAVSSGSYVLGAVRNAGSDNDAHSDLGLSLERRLFRRFSELRAGWQLLDGALFTGVQHRRFVLWRCLSELRTGWQLLESAVYDHLRRRQQLLRRQLSILRAGR